jgi:hypothetical protein
MSRPFYTEYKMCKKYKMIKSEFYKSLLSTVLISLPFQLFLSRSVKSYVTCQTPVYFSPKFCSDYNVKNNLQEWRYELMHWSILPQNRV